MKPGRVVALVVALLLALGAGFWAGRVTLRPASTQSEVAASAVVVPVSVQTVGRSLNLNVTVTQPKQALATNSLVGVVTAVSKPGTFANGAVLYEVAGEPVRVVTGTLPFYRDLASGDSGKDVAQLRAALHSLGYLAEASGASFDAATVAAVKAWQTKLGTPATGTVKLGELVVVPKLPAALLLDDKVLQVGALLAGGEKIVFGASGIPSFDLVVSQDQAQLIPQTATVAIDHEGKTWKAVITGSDTDENQQTVFHLKAPDGGPVCGADCASVATGSQLYLLSQVQVVPPATGPAVPVAAISTDASGKATVTVIKADGSRETRPVTVIGSQDGVAVVQGVQAGEKVQVMSGAAPAASSAPPSASASR